MGQYDQTLKSLVDTNPEAMAHFVLHMWQKQQGATVLDTPIMAATLLNSEFQSEELRGDSILLLEGADGPLYVVEIEFQSTLDDTMPLRSLEYLARTKKKHWKHYGDLPVVAVVIYLFDTEHMPECPMRWAGLNGTTAMVFDFLIIKLQDMERSELQALQEPCLWPLVLMTRGRVDRILVEEMFADLLERKLYNTLPIGHMIASWFLEGKDSDWLEEEFQKMYEIFGDAPAIQWIKDKAREEERKRIEAERQAERKHIEDEHKRIEAERQAERKRNETQWKKAALEIISIRAPKLKRLAKTQIATITNYEELEQLIVQLSLADGIYEIEDILCSLHEQKIQEGDEQ